MFVQKMAQNCKNMQYLTVNTEDYLHPLRSTHRRLSGSISPALSLSSALDEAHEVHGLRKFSGSKSLMMLHKLTASDTNLSTCSATSNASNDSTTTSNSHFRKAFHKSTESLCFGTAKKKLHRRAHVSEIYRPRCNTDPVGNAEREISVPILTIPRRSAGGSGPVALSASSSFTSSAAPTPLLKRRATHHGQHNRTSSALSSLIENALKVTTASVGLRANEKEETTKSAITNDENVQRRCSSVSTFAATPIDNSSMAPLQSHTEAQSVTTLNSLDRDHSANNTTAVRQQLSQQSLDKYQQHQSLHQRQVSGNGSCHSDCYSTAYSTTYSESSTQNSSSNGHSKDDVRSLKHSSSNLNTLEPGVSTVSIRSLSPSSRKSASSSNSSNTAKHEQSTAAATAAASAAASTEKEKKRKEVSSSRVKKFHRHFTQVSKDEKLINYFSCALVSDILLQGHLYITDQHFAFYSNVFGYVTKVVIPTSSVTKISKEKTAKIIPNAVGVATADERHVFGSFISREAAFRLMCSVCPPLAPAELLPKAPADIEISEEYSIEDDSSCSISGNESPPQALAAAAAAAGLTIDDANGGTLLRRAVANSSTNVTASDKLRHSDIPANANSNFAQHQNAGVRASAPPGTRYNNANGSANNNKNTSTSNTATAASTSSAPAAANANVNSAPTLSDNVEAAAAVATNPTLIVAGTTSSTTSTSSSSPPSPSTSSSPPTTVMVPPKSAAQTAMESFKTLSQKALLRLKFPTELHVVYLGVLLTMVLALFSVFLLYRILDIEAKTSTYRTPIEFNWQRTSNDDDIFAEALRWQKELQAKNTEEAQSILTKNLEQIAKVRRSLETLSMLIHDRSSAYANRDDSD